MWLYFGNFSLWEEIWENGIETCKISCMKWKKKKKKKKFWPSPTLPCYLFSWFMNHVFFCSAWQPTLLFLHSVDVVKEVPILNWNLLSFASFSLFFFLECCIINSIYSYTLHQLYLLSISCETFTPLSITLIIPDMAVTIQRFFVWMKLVTMW